MKEIFARFDADTKRYLLLQEPSDPFEADKLPIRRQRPPSETAVRAYPLFPEQRHKAAKQFFTLGRVARTTVGHHRPR